MRNAEECGRAGRGAAFGWLKSGGVSRGASLVLQRGVDKIIKYLCMIENNTVEQIYI